MSVQALSWVFDHSPTTGADRLVLLAIANHANEDLEAWPSIALIQREAGLAREQTVRDALKRLIEGGHVSRIVHGAPDERIPGDRKPNLYRILDPTRDVGSSDVGPSPRPHASRTNDPTRNALTTPRETGGKPSLEPSLEPSSHSPSPAATDDTSLPEPTRALPKGVDPDAVDELCLLLADRVEAHRGVRPTITGAWRSDMGTLLNSGGAGVEDEPPTAEHVARVINATFDRLNVRSSSGFCWADQVRAPSGLRGKWEQLRFALNHHRRTGQAPAEDVLAAMEQLDRMGVSK